MNQSPIKAILFDMDGTLIKHTWQYEQITSALFEKFADALAPVTRDEFYSVFWTKNVDMWYMMIDGAIDGDTAQRYSYVNTLRALGKELTLADEMVAAWVKLVLAEASPFEDTFSVLETLRRKYTVGIVTNGFSTMQRAKINHYGLDDHVDFSLVSEEVGFHKPDVRIFEAALRRAGNVLPSQAVFIGDNLTTDIAGALASGIHPVWVAGTADGTPPDGVATIQSLTDLLALLPNI